MKQQYDQKLKEIIKLNKTQFLDKEKKWNEEKRNLHQTLELTKQQIEENRKMHQQLMAAINEKRSSAKNNAVAAEAPSNVRGECPMGQSIDFSNQGSNMLAASSVEKFNNQQK